MVLGELIKKTAAFLRHNEAHFLTDVIGYHEAFVYINKKMYSQENVLLSHF